MRSLHLILIGIAIPMLLTATVFAAPGGGIFSSQANDATNLQNSNLISRDTGGIIATADAQTPVTHTILLSANSFDNGQLAFKMESHLIDGLDSGRVYSTQPSIPGPTIVINEGDQVEISIFNNIDDAEDMTYNKVSLHVHGVHYTIDNDGTLEHINMIEDQGAGPDDTKEFTWTAGLGTAGTWPYHDHTFGGINGAEHKGLFGALIVNPASGTVRGTDGNTIVEAVPLGDITKDFVLYIGDDAFWGMELTPDGEQTPLWVNPTLVAKKGEYARFHLIALGTDFHEFKLSNIKWLDPGTNNLISKKDIGPLENHVFTIKADKSNTEYVDLQESNNLMGMNGKLKVTNDGGDSIPGPSPL